MKTFHRLMYENLTPDEWKELCKVGNVWVISANEESCSPCTDFTDIPVYEALGSLSFSWELTPQGFDYWSGVSDRLLSEEV